MESKAIVASVAPPQARSPSLVCPVAMATVGTVESERQFDLEKELEAVMADKVEDAGDDKVEGEKEDEGTEVKIDKVDGEKAEDKGFKVYFYRGSARMGPVRVAGDTSTLAIQQLLDDPAKATKLRVAKATKPVDCNLAIKHDKEFTVVEGVLDVDVDYYLVKKEKTEATKKAKAEAAAEKKAWKEARSALPKPEEPPKKRACGGGRKSEPLPDWLTLDMTELKEEHLNEGIRVEGRLAKRAERNTATEADLEILKVLRVHLNTAVQKEGGARAAARAAKQQADQTERHLKAAITSNQRTMQLAALAAVEP